MSSTTYETHRVTTVKRRPGRPRKKTTKLGSFEIFESESELVLVDACVPKPMAFMFQAFFDAYKNN